MTVRIEASSLRQRWAAWRAGLSARRVRRRLQRRCPEAQALQQRLPAGLQAAWRAHASEEFPGLPSREADWLLASTGLMQFFLAAARAAGPCALPSRAADAVWHAWLHWDAAGLRAFQVEHLGREVPHLPESRLPGPLDQALSRCYAACCRLEQLNPLDGRLPLLFALDHRLRMPGGWHYVWHRRLRCLTHQVLDLDGDPRGRPQFHAVHGASLLGLGLLTAAEQSDWERQRQGLVRPTRSPPARRHRRHGTQLRQQLWQHHRRQLRRRRRLWWRQRRRQQLRQQLRKLLRRRRRLNRPARARGYGPGTAPPPSLG